MKKLMIVAVMVAIVTLATTIPVFAINGGGSGGSGYDAPRAIDTPHSGKVCARSYN